MASVKQGKEPEGEGLDPNATSMGGYYTKMIDVIREREFPTLQGRLAELHMLGKETHLSCRGNLS